MLAPDHGEAGDSRSNQYDGLDTIAKLLDVERHQLGEWDETYARLFAIDCAYIVFRYHTPHLNDSARDLMQGLLHQSCKLVTAGRDPELGSIERALLGGLDASSSITRQVWLVALNSVLPDPFRAAAMSTEAALATFGRGPNPHREAVAESMRRRLLSRTEESALLGSARTLHREPSAVA